MDETARADDADLEAANERFRVDSRLEIVSLLATLVERGVLVSVTFGRDVVNTVLLAVDTAAGEIVFDAGQSEEVNARLATATKLAFDTSLERIRIRFRGGTAVARTWQGAPAFACAMPTTLIRLQRRDFFRAHVPLASGLRCALRLPGADGASRAPVMLSVLDVSVTGIALTELPAGFMPTPGTRLVGARLVLATGPRDVELEVMHCRAAAPGAASGAPMRIGCRFVDLAPRGQALIQRCINALERERRSRT
jgi:c-di-GMP-binding flagellar brake protein YcgR